MKLLFGSPVRGLSPGRFFLMDKITEIFKRYNDGEFLKDLAEEYNINQSVLSDQIAAHLNMIIENFRSLPKDKRLEYNEHQRKLLAKEIARRTPELCAHEDTTEQAGGWIFCHQCERYIDTKKSKT